VVGAEASTPGKKSRKSQGSGAGPVAVGDMHMSMHTAIAALELLHWQNHLASVTTITMLKPQLLTPGKTQQFHMISIG